MGRRDNQQQNIGELGRRERTTQTDAPLGRRTGTTQVEAPTPTQPKQRRDNAFTNLPSNLRLLREGHISPTEVAKAAPRVAKEGAIKTVDTVAPGLSNFTRQAGGAIGEGIAFAVDPRVREHHLAGNPDILPTITGSTAKGMIRDTAAAALEAVIIRGVPGGLKKNIAARGGIGLGEGLGFAVTEGIARDHSVEEIVKNAKLYGVSGAALNVALPWLGPLLRKELGRTPPAIKAALKKEIVEDEASSVISYINKDDEKVYTTLTKDELEGLRDEVRMIPEPGKGESQIHLDAKTPTLESQGKRVSREDFIAGHSQAGQTLEGAIPQAPTTAPKGVQQVQGEQVPIGGPTKGASRLEARLVAEAEDPARQAAVSNYARFSKAADAPEVTGSSNPEQIRRAAQAVDSLSASEVNAIVSGNTPLPDGVLRTAFLKAATEKALLEGNSGLVNRLSRAAGQLARRFGQEIQFTKNFDPLDPVTNIADILNVRLKAAERRLPKGQTVTGITRTSLKEATEETTKTQLKFKEAEDLIDSILC